MRIALCGMDGAGKSALANHLMEFFDKKNYLVQIAKVDFSCKDICNDVFSEKEKSDEVSLINRIGMAFDFVKYYQHFSDYKGILICDRYDICYQVFSYVDNLPSEYIYYINKLYASVVKPDIYIYLDLPVDIASHRLNERGNRADNESDEILRKVAYYYPILLKGQKNVVVIDASDNEEVVFKTVTEHITRLLF